MEKDYFGSQISKLLTKDCSGKQFLLLLPILSHFYSACLWVQHRLLRVSCTQYKLATSKYASACAALSKCLAEFVSVDLWVYSSEMDTRKYEILGQVLYTYVFNIPLLAEQSWGAESYDTSFSFSLLNGTISGHGHQP